MILFLFLQLSQIKFTGRQCIWEAGLVTDYIFFFTLLKTTWIINDYKLQLKVINNKSLKKKNQQIL